MFPTLEVIGAPVCALPFLEQVGLMVDWASAHEQRIVCIANVHMVMEAHWSQEFAQVLAEADLVTPDGMPVVWMLKCQGVRGAERVAGMDVLTAVCHKAQARELPIFFLGSTDGVLDLIRKRLGREYPQLCIADMYSPPFREMTEEEDRNLIERINQSGARLVFVALGCPKQEKWMHAHRGKVKAVMVGLGGAFPVFAGQQAWAPAWLRSMGLEWLFRLYLEPGRLWKRYWQTNVPFLGLALRQLLRTRRRRSNNFG